LKLSKMKKTGGFHLDGRMRSPNIEGGIPFQNFGMIANIGIPIAGLGSQSAGQSKGSRTMTGAQQFATILGSIGSKLTRKAKGPTCSQMRWAIQASTCYPLSPVLKAKDGPMHITNLKIVRAAKAGVSRVFSVKVFKLRRRRSKPSADSSKPETTQPTQSMAPSETMQAKSTLSLP
jgi:hypothetical protein